MVTERQRVMKTIFIDEKVWLELKPYFKNMRTSFSKEIELFLSGLLDKLKQGDLNSRR